MALVLRLKDDDSILLKLEDGRELKICIKVQSPNRAVAYLDIPRSIRIDRIHGKKKEFDERARNPSE